MFGDNTSTADQVHFRFPANSSSASSSDSDSDSVVDIDIDDSDVDSSSELATKNYYVLYLFVVPIFTIFGNVLVTMAVTRERQLRTPTGYIIFSLAVADILVGAIVMPFCILEHLEQAAWQFGDFLCHFYVMCDVMFCTASILHLAAISFDRYIAVLWPIAYSNTELQRKRVLCMLACTWLLAFLIALPLVTTMDVHRFINETQKYECTFQNDDYLIYSSLFSFYVPFMIMTVLYATLLQAVRAHTRNSALYIAFSAHSKQFRSILGQSSRSNSTRSRARSSRSRLFRARLHLGNSRHTRKVCAKNAAPTIVLSNQSSASASAVECHSNETSEACYSRTGQAQAQASASSEELTPLRSGSVHASPHFVPHKHRPTQKQRTAANGFATAATIPLQTSLRRSSSTPVSLNVSGLLTINESPPRLANANGNGNGNGNGTSNFRLTDHNHNHLMVDGPRDWRTHRRQSQSLLDLSAISNARAADAAPLQRLVSSQITQNLEKRERKVTITLAVVLGVFIGCWLPFFTANILRAVCMKAPEIRNSSALCGWPFDYYTTWIWLGYINSMLNPVIYCAGSADFRKAFGTLLFRTRWRRF